MNDSGFTIVYYTPPGSYDGLVRIRGRWIRTTELNRIDKRLWVRWKGPPTKRMTYVLRATKSIPAEELVPWRIKFPSQRQGEQR